MTNTTRKTSSAEIVASIVHLLSEILVRLPIKPLFRFKQVSKQWKSLISDPGFVIRRNPIPNHVAGVFVPRQFPCGYVHVSFSNKESTRKKIRSNNVDHDVFKIIQSCKGLLLCYNSDFDYFVYNPTTDKCSSTIREWQRETELSLAFDPIKSRHYKVVCVRFLLDYGDIFEFEFEIYSSESGSWRKRTGYFTDRFSFTNGVYWNGAIHWFDHKTGGCLYFNPDNENDDPFMMERMTPYIPTVMVPMFYFGESCGHLSYVGYNQVSYLVNVYELRTDYSEWFVKYIIDLSPIYDAVYNLPGGDEGGWEWLWFFAFTSTMLVRGEKDEDSFLVVLLTPKVIVRYNFVQGNYETICDFEDDNELNFAMLEGCFQYIESLCFT